MHESVATEESVVAEQSDTDVVAPEVSAMHESVATEESVVAEQSDTDVAAPEVSAMHESVATEESVVAEQSDTDVVAPEVSAMHESVATEESVVAEQSDTDVAAPEVSAMHESVATEESVVAEQSDTDVAAPEVSAMHESVATEESVVAEQSDTDVVAPEVSAMHESVATEESVVAEQSDTDVAAPEVSAMHESVATEESVVAEQSDTDVVAPEVSAMHESVATEESVVAEQSDTDVVAPEVSAMHESVATDPPDTDASVTDVASGDDSAAAEPPVAEDSGKRKKVRFFSIPVNSSSSEVPTDASLTLSLDTQDEDFPQVEANGVSRDDADVRLVFAQDGAQQLFVDSVVAREEDSPASVPACSSEVSSGDALQEVSSSEPAPDAKAAEIVDGNEAFDPLVHFCETYLTDEEHAFLVFVSLFRRPVSDVAVGDILRVPADAAEQGAVARALAVLDDESFQALLERLVAYRLLAFDEEAGLFSIQPAIRAYVLQRGRSVAGGE